MGVLDIGPDEGMAVDSVAAHDFRTALETLTHALRDGSVTAAQVLSDPPPTVDIISINHLLENVPGVGHARAAALLDGIGVVPNRPLCSLSHREREALTKALGAAEQEVQQVVGTWTATNLAFHAVRVTARKDESEASLRIEGLSESIADRIASIVCDAARATDFKPPQGVVVSASERGVLEDPVCLLAVAACALAADGQVPEADRLADMILVGTVLENGTCVGVSSKDANKAQSLVIPGSRIVSAAQGVSLSALHDGPLAFAAACDSLAANPPLQAWAVTFKRTEQVTLRVAARSREEARNRAANLINEPEVVEKVECALDAETGRYGAYDEWDVAWRDVIPLTQAAPDELLGPPTSATRDARAR